MLLSKCAHVRVMVGDGDGVGDGEYVDGGIQVV